MRAFEFINEATNADIHDNRFQHEVEIGGLRYTAEADNNSGYGTQLIIKVYDGRTEIATTEFMIDEDHNSLVSANTWVLPKYQDQGVASTMYAYAKMLGNDVVPSRIQTDQGNSMWRAWNQKKQSKHILPRGHKGYNEISESLNPETLNINFRFEQEIDGLNYVASVEQDPTTNKKKFIIKAYGPAKDENGDNVKDENGNNVIKEVGVVRFAPYKNKDGVYWLESDVTSVNQFYRKHGVTRTMYALAKMLGNDIKPSGDQSVRGKAMWDSWRDSGDAQHIMPQA